MAASARLAPAESPATRSGPRPAPTRAGEAGMVRRHPVTPRNPPGSGWSGRPGVRPAGRSTPGGPPVRPPAAADPGIAGSSSRRSGEDIGAEIDNGGDRVPQGRDRGGLVAALDRLEDRAVPAGRGDEI